MLEIASEIKQNSKNQQSSAMDGRSNGAKHY
jgi:hypothetical protein